MRPRRRRRRRAIRHGLLAVSVALCGRPAPLGAQDVATYVGKPVASVRMQLEGRELQDRSLLDLVDTRVGQPLRMADVRETMVHLHGLGRFQDVEVHASLTPAATVDLLFELVPLHSVRSIVFRGQLGVSGDVLRDFVQDRFGVSPPSGRAAEIARTLTQLLNDRGFFTARVSPEAVVEHAPERTTLFFTVEAGERARMGTVTVTGEEPRESRSVRTRPALQSGEPFDRARIEAELARYGRDLKSRGYYLARANWAKRERDDRRIVDLDISVEAGPRIEIVFKGDPLPAKARAELVPIEKEGSVDEDLLEDSRARIEAYLQAQGYKNAAAPYEWSGDDRRRVLAFTIDRGGQFRVADIEFSGHTAMTVRELAALVRTERGKPFVQATLTADLARIREAYLQRGYRSVKADQVLAQTGVGPPAPLAVKIQITEGPRTELRAFRFVGNTALTADQLNAAITARPGQPYYDPRIAADRESITLAYLNRGYPTVNVESAVAFNEDPPKADVRFTITEGPQVFVDHILIVGNHRTSTDLIAREITLRPGQALGLDAVMESQRRLSALGLFRRVRITELAHGGDDRRRDLLVTVEEAPRTTYGFGGGVEGERQLRRASGGDAQGQAEEVFQVAPRGFFEIGRRNLWGKNRRVNLFTRVTLRPRNATTSADPTAPQGGYGFNEYRVVGTLREPRLLDTAADGLLTGFVEQGIRSSFNFARRAVQGEVARRLRPPISVLGRYSFEQARIFDERYDEKDKPKIDRFFPQVRLSSFSGAIVRDTRDDPLDPSRGVFASVESKLAARAIGSEVGFVRTFVQTFVFKALPAKRRAIFAGAARLGIASGFPREVIVRDEAGNPVLGDGGQPLVDVVRDIPASERFFSGGATTVRGFGLDRLGAAGVIDSAGFSRGGDALLVLNAELRVDVRGGLSVAGFLDAGNVFARPRDVRVNDIRPTAGFGLRYKSPVGPLRFDIGFNLDRRRVAGRLEDTREYHLTLGQAF